MTLKGVITDLFVFIFINQKVGERLNKPELHLIEKPDDNILKNKKCEIEKMTLMYVYRSLYNAGKLSLEQLKYLENLNRNYWQL